MWLRSAIAALALLGSHTALADGFRPSDDDRLVLSGRAILAREYPQVMQHMQRQNGFGGPHSPLIARAMLSDAPELIAEARAKMTIEPQGRGLWLIRFPFVNVALIETRDSLVLFDSGYAAIGPVLRDVIPTLSKKPLKTIIISHVHVDHAYGARALLNGPVKPQVITSALYRAMIAKEVRLGGSIGRYNNQPLPLQPVDMAQVVKPDIVFDERLEKTIGGEKFVLFHAKGETEEQIWLWMPGRKAVFTADYYQGFLPNAGNGKRIMRHVDEWAGALRQMAALKPLVMMPMHGAALAGEQPIHDALTLHAGALEHISNQVVTRLNAGERKDRIAASIDWPDRFAKSPLLDQQYNRPEDIARMVAMRWTGWWDDIPSHYAALPFEDEAKEALQLAGGVDAVDKRARELLLTNSKLAARLADWAYFGAPDNPKALRLAVDVYIARIAEADMPVQEALVYFDTAARGRALLEKLPH
jgi:alkyl sulfatase BDS1-like metallo-beta-lactamase superfamily hydrolase